MTCTLQLAYGAQSGQLAAQGSNLCTAKQSATTNAGVELGVQVRLTGQFPLIYMAIIEVEATSAYQQKAFRSTCAKQCASHFNNRHCNVISC